MAKGQFKYVDAGDTVKIGYTHPDNPASVVIQLECKKPANKSQYATAQSSDAVKGLQDPPRWQVDVPEPDTESFPAVIVKAYGADSLDKASATNLLDTDFVVFNANKASGKATVIRSVDTPDIPEKAKPQLTADQLEKLTPIRQWIVGYLVPRACPATAGEVEKDGSKRFDDNVQTKEDIEKKWDAEAAKYQQNLAAWASEHDGKSYSDAVKERDDTIKANLKFRQDWIKDPANKGKPIPADKMKDPPAIDATIANPDPATKGKQPRLPISVPHYTTCGAFAAYVSKGSNTPTNDGKKTGPDAPLTTSGGMLGGLIGTMWAGRDSDGGGWVTARPGGAVPKPGDFLMLSGSPRVYPKDAKIRIGANCADDIDALPKDDKKSVQDPRNGIEVMHVGVFVKTPAEGLDADTYLTADGGQGGPAKKDGSGWKPPQATAYSTRAMMKDPKSGELLMVAPKNMASGQPDAGSRRIAGWVDVDQHQWKNKPQKFADLPDSVQSWLKALGVKTSSQG